MQYLRDTREKSFLINDEYLNGYARLCGINATGVYISLCRHANKKQTCFPSKRLIAEELSISERSVYTALKTLMEWNIITIEDQGRKNDGSFKNKIYTLINKVNWKEKPPQANGAVGRKRQPPQANDDTHRRQQVPNKETHKEGNTYKETHIAKQSFADKNSLLIVEIIKLFKTINPACKKMYGNTTQREACDFLIKEFGFERVKKIIETTLPKTNGMDFFPTITTPCKLRDKWSDLEVAIKRYQSKKQTEQVKKGNVYF